MTFGLHVSPLEEHGRFSWVEAMRFERLGGISFKPTLVLVNLLTSGKRRLRGDCCWRSFGLHTTPQCRSIKTN